MFGARMAAISLGGGQRGRFPAGRWSCPASMAAPGGLHADVWCFDLDVKTDITPLAACLTPDERARATRFRFETHRRRFAAFRGLLRHLLAQYLQMAPESVSIGVSSNGKPYLAIAPRAPLQFSVSHSEDCALFAFTGAPAVGIDCECVPRRRQFDLDGLAGRVLNEEERTYLSSPGMREDGLRREAGFLKLWTVKEATLKAIGAGLDRDLAAVCALPAVVEPDGDMWQLAQDRALRRWSFCVEGTCVAALAVQLP